MIEEVVVNPLAKTIKEDKNQKKMVYDNNKKKRDTVAVRVDLISDHLIKNKRNDKNEVMIMEIDSNGDSYIKQLSLRDLLLFVDSKASIIDENIESVTSAPDMVSCLQHRDLRRLDFHYNAEEEPIVIVRRHAVLIAFDPLRAIIMADRIIIIVPPGADSILNTLQEQMKAWKEGKKQSEEDHTRIKRSLSVSSDSDEFFFFIPFESHAYEVIISTVYSLQLQDYELMNTQIMKLLTHFNYAIVSIHVQETMRLLKNRVMQTIGKIHTFRKTLSDLLENDEDLALMNLTKLKDKPSLYNIPLDSKLLASHEEIEILLESYLTDYNSLETKLVYLRTQMQNAEELVMLRLDTSRNQLLIVDNVISVVTAALAFGSFIGSIFGMNFDSNIWKDPTGFRSVTIITVIGMVIGTLVTIIYFQKTGIIPSKQTKTSRLQSLKIL